jgi:hypothetical protein
MYQVVVKNTEGELLFYTSACRRSDVVNILTHWQVAVGVVDSMPEPSYVAGLRNNPLLRNVEIWGATFARPSGVNFLWDFQRHLVEIDRSIVSDSLGEAGILCRAAIARDGHLTVNAIGIDDEPGVSPGYTVRISGGRDVEEAADSAAVVDGCLVLQRQGQVVAVYAKGWWERVNLDEEED